MPSITKDNLLIVHCHDHLPPNWLLFLRSVLDGLVTALHIKLNYSSKQQLQLMMRRHLFALDLNKAIDHVSDSCHTCALLKTFPNTLVKQSSENSTETVGAVLLTMQSTRHSAMH